MKLKFLLLATAVALSSCGDSNSRDGFIRIVHNSPDAPAVDVAFDGNLVAEGASYGDATGFLPVGDGSTRVRVLASGTDLAVIDAEVEVTEHQSLTILASNRLANIAPKVLVSRRTPINKSEVTVRAVHGAPSAPAVDIYVTAPGADISSANPVLTQVPFGAASDYLSIPAVPTQIRVTVAGTKTVAIDSGSLDLTAGSVLTLVARDNRGGGAPFSFLVLSER